MNDSKENLKFFYEMCMKEYNKASANLEEYQHLINATLESVQSNDMNHAQFLTLYDQALGNLSQISDILRKFNIQVELTKLKPIENGVAELSISPITPNIDVDATPLIEIENFIFPLNDFSLYKINYKSDCTITYIKNASKKLFYLMDLDSKYHTGDILRMEKYFEDSPLQLSTLPKPGIVFGYYMDDYMFRAVRENETNSIKKSTDIKIFLIDVGEITTYTPKTAAIYALSEFLQKIPAQAILCKLDKCYDSSSSPEMFLRKNLYVKQKFKIIKITKNILHVELSPIKPLPTNPFLEQESSTNSSSSSDKSVTENTLSNPFHHFRFYNKLNKKQHKNNNNNTKIEENRETSNVKMNIHPILPKSDFKINNNDLLTMVTYNVDTFQDTKERKKESPLKIEPFNFNYGSSKKFDFSQLNGSKKHELTQLVTQTFQPTTATPLNNYVNTHSTMLSEKQPFIYNYNNINPELPMITTIHNDSCIQKPPVYYSDKSSKSLPTKTCLPNKDRAVPVSEQGAAKYPQLSPQTFPQIASYKLTPEELENLYEEPFCTENAMVAVMGYDPQDEKRICKFYNSKTNSCFKGGHCTKEHASKIEDGWTSDKTLTRISTRTDISFPKIGSTVNVIITHVMDVESFYVQIPTQNESHAPTLKEIILKMNGSEILSSLVPYKETLPVEQELVFAMYMDNQWYRAKVYNVLDEYNIKVFYVDFGNCQMLQLDKIRRWDNRFDYYPFQAIRCRLNNIEKIKELHAEAIAYFRKMVLNKNLVAKIINNIDQLHVTLTEEEGFDIGELLCAANYAKLKSSNKGIFSNKGIIPG